MQERSASLRTLTHVRHLLLMHLLQLFLLIFLFSVSLTHSHHICMVSPHPGWIHAFSQSAANSSVTHHRLSASTLPCDLIFFVKSFIIVVLCCCFISSSLRGLLLLALQSLQVVLSGQNKDSCPAIFSPPSYFVIFCFCAPVSTPAQGLSFTVLNLVLVQNLILYFSASFFPH